MQEETDKRYAIGLDALRKAVSQAVERSLQPPPKLTLSEWASRYGVLSRETSAQTGRFRPFPYQVGMMDAITDPAVTRVTVMKSARVGYALALDTPIPTPSGWVPMGQITVGDVVFGSDGKPHPVSFVSPVFHDHDCYRVTFCDGSEIIADGGHRWHVEADKSIEYMRGDRGKGRIGRPKPGETATKVGLMTTAEMAMVCTPRRRHSLAIRNAAPLDLAETEFPLAPYALGVWLGDGNYEGFRITSHRSDVCEMAAHLDRAGLRTFVEYRDSRYPDNATITANLIPGSSTQKRRERSEIPKALREIGVWKNKHIPALYLRSSALQRLELLRGLMDTDGTIGAKGFAEFTNTNERIAAAVYEIVVSLGMKASWSIREPSAEQRLRASRCLGYTINHSKRQFRVVFKADPDINPFHLSRKATKVKALAKPTVTRRRRVVSVERVAPVPVRCISVESPGNLFLCGRAMVPTHNTRMLDFAVAYFVHQDPSPVMVVQPRVEDAEDYSKTEIAPMLRDTPELAAIAGNPKAKDSNQTILKKTFSNGASLKLIGANSPGGFRRITVRVAAFDEVDGYPAGGAGQEGDQIELGVKRTLTFWNRKIIIGSTPTVKGISRIERSWEDSDQRRFYVPCPHCGEFQTLEWGGKDLPYGLKWEKDEKGGGKPETVYYVCKANGCLIHEVDKPEMVGRGEWRASKPFNGHAGFHIWAAYSLFPNACWANLVEEWLKVKNDPLARQTYINLVRGEPYEDRGDKALAEAKLAARCEVWPAEVPDGTALISAGADVQDDRVEIEVVGWGRNEESWSVAHEVIEGDPEEPKLWTAVDAYLKRIWHRGDGRGFEVAAVCIDSGGHHTQKVYEFAKARLGRKVWAIKGESARGGQRSPIWPTKRPSARNKASFRPVILGVNAAKDVIRARLHLEKAGPGYMHFPVDRDINYFAQLTSERLVTKQRNGQRFRVWELPPGRANEALDIRVYAYAALCGLMYFGLKLNRKADDVTANIGPTIEAGQPENETAAPASTGPHVTKSSTSRNLASMLA